MKTEGGAFFGLPQGEVKAYLPGLSNADVVAAV